MNEYIDIVVGLIFIGSLVANVYMLGESCFLKNQLRIYKSDYNNLKTRYDKIINNNLTIYKQTK